MSLVYSLDLEAALTPEDLNAAVCAVPEFRCSGAVISAPAWSVRVGTPGRLGVEMIREQIGFTPHSSVRFYRDSDVDPPAARLRLIRACASVLFRYPGDAVLLFNNEIVILVRRSGRLVLNPVEGFWDDEVLQALSMRYTFEPMEQL